MSPNLKISNM